MSKRLDFAVMMERARSRDTYWTECAVIEFTEELCRAMEAQSITRAELARRLDVSPAFITKVLRGDGNLTVETMAKLARAVGTELRMHLQAEGCLSTWYDHLPTSEADTKRKVDLTRLMDGFVPVTAPTAEEARDDRLTA